MPPSIGGDLDLTVEKGRTISITLQDLTALDPDDEAKDLIFTISNAKNGHVALVVAPARPVTRFTQADHTGRDIRRAAAVKVHVRA